MPDDHDLNLRGRLIRSLGALREMFPARLSNATANAEGPSQRQNAFHRVSRQSRDLTATWPAPTHRVAKSLGPQPAPLNKKPYILDYDKYSLS